MKYFIRFVSGVNPKNNQQRQMLDAFEKIDQHTTINSVVVNEYVSTIIAKANAEHPRCKPANYAFNERRDKPAFFISSGDWHAYLELLEIKGEL